MVGTGVFTSLGFQVMGMHSAWSVMILWIIGGVIAFTGALCYAELATIHTRSGGEYHILSFLYGKPIGFMAGWVSMIVGFAAPVAAAAMALARYFSASMGWASDPHVWLSADKIIALIVVTLVSLAHFFHKTAGAVFQNIFTTIKILFIVFFIGAGLAAADYTLPQFHQSQFITQDLLSTGFAISIYFVLYSYSGWNAVSYFAGEVERPEKNIARSLLAGTAIVTVLYILLNLAFMSVLSFGEVQGQLEVGYVFTNKLYGARWGSIMGFVIAFLLVSSISSMVVAGPRVIGMIGKDYRRFDALGRTNAQGIPQSAIFFQYALTVVYVLTSYFDQMITLIGFMLNLFTFLCVVGLVIYRLRYPEQRGYFRVKWLGLVAGIFILVNLWVLYYGFRYKTTESLIGIGFSLVGLLGYYVVRHTAKQPEKVLD